MEPAKTDPPPKKVVFCSSTQYGPFMAGTIRAMSAHGMKVQQMFSVSLHHYWSAGSRLERAWLRFRCYVIYPLRLIIRQLLNRRDDCTVVCTNTFYAPFVASLASRRKPVVNLVYDFYPEALETAGVLKPATIPARCIAALTGLTFRKCQANVFLGEKLRKHAMRRYKTIPNAWVIPVGADETMFTQFPEHNDDAPVTFLYAGHLGHMHDTGTLAGALTQLDSELLDKTRFIFHASGPRAMPMRRKLASVIKNAPNAIELNGALETNAWTDAMKKADIGLVTLIPGAEKVAMPSKAYSSLAAGQAVLAVCRRESDLADIILEHDCGWIVEPGDIQGLLDILKSIINNPAEVQRKRRNAWYAGHNCYSSAVIADQWQDLIRQLTE